MSNSATVDPVPVDTHAAAQHATALHEARVAAHAAAVIGSRGPASFVWGDFVTEAGSTVIGAAGAWAPLPAGQAGLRVTASATEGIVIGGETVDGTAVLYAYESDGPTVAYFADGAEGVIFTYDDTKYALQVWNPGSEWARRFDGISAYGYDPSWVVDAAIVPVAEGRTVAISHHRDPRPVEVPIVAEVRFARDGVEHALAATSAGAASDGILLLFTDTTNGEETYSSGRVLRISDVTDGAVRLDFNETTLLPCSFSLAWNCPIPAAENHLDVPVRAGERNAIDSDGKVLL